MLIKAIDELRYITITLPTLKIDYSQYDYFNSMVREVKAAAKANQFEQFTEEEIEAIILYSLHILEVPENLDGCRLARPCTMHLLKRAFEQLLENQPRLNLDFQSIENPFFRVINAWNEELEASDRAELDYHPTISRSFPLSFHLKAFDESTKKYEPDAKKRIERKVIFEPYLYEAFGFVFHRKLMSKLNKTNIISTKSSYELAARNAFEYASDSERIREDHDRDNYTRELTDDWQKNYSESDPSRTRETDITTKEKFRIFDNLMDIRRKPASKSIQVKRRSKDDDPDDGEAPDGGPDEQSKVRKKRNLILAMCDENKDENSIYDPALDQYPDFTDTPLPRPGKKMRAYWHDSPHSRFVSFFWDVHGLNSGHL